jgi:hypothetical protein
MPIDSNGNQEIAIAITAKRQGHMRLVFFSCFSPWKVLRASQRLFMQPKPKASTGMVSLYYVRITASQSSIAHVLLEAIGGDLIGLMGDGCSIQSDIPGRSLSAAMRGSRCVGQNYGKGISRCARLV